MNRCFSRLLIVWLAALAPAAWAQSAGDVAAAQLVQRYFRLMFEVRDVEAAAALLSPDFRSHHQPAETTAQMLARFKAQRGDRAPDLAAPQLQPQVLMVQQPYVFMLLAPPPRPGETPQRFFELYRLEGERIAEHWDAHSAALAPAR